MAYEILSGSRLKTPTEKDIRTVANTVKVLRRSGVTLTEEQEREVAQMEEWLRKVRARPVGADKPDDEPS